MTVEAIPTTTRRLAYGPHPDQWGELHLPGGPAPRGVVVIIHGGFWRDRYTAELGRPIAQDLAEGGFAAWNLEYRRAGSGGAAGAGGWPMTFLDIAAGIDFLAQIPAEVGLGTVGVAALGHSAGGHLAVWAAGRHVLPPGAPGADPVVRLSGAVSQAGALDLLAVERWGLSEGAAVNLMGGSSEELPEAFAQADPMRSLPIGVPVHAVHSREDDSVPFELSERYVAAARAAGDPAELHEVGGDHFAVITVGHEAYRVCRSLIRCLLA